MQILVWYFTWLCIHRVGTLVDSGRASAAPLCDCTRGVGRRIKWEFESKLGLHRLLNERRDDGLGAFSKVAFS